MTRGLMYPRVTHYKHFITNKIIGTRKAHTKEKDLSNIWMKGRQRYMIIYPVLMMCFDISCASQFDVMLEKQKKVMRRASKQYEESKQNY